MSKKIALKHESGAEYSFRFPLIFQSEKDKIDQAIRDAGEDYQKLFEIKRDAVMKHGEAAKVGGKGEVSFTDFTPANEALVSAAFNYFTNSQIPDFRFLDD